MGPTLTIENYRTERAHLNTWETEVPQLVEALGRKITVLCAASKKSRLIRSISLIFFLALAVTASVAFQKMAPVIYIKGLASAAVVAFGVVLHQDSRLRQNDKVKKNLSNQETVLKSYTSEFFSWAKNKALGPRKIEASEFPPVAEENYPAVPEEKRSLTGDKLNDLYLISPFSKAKMLDCSSPLRKTYKSRVRADMARLTQFIRDNFPKEN